MKKRKFLPVAIALVAVIAVSGVAYAYWTAGGTGTGSGSTADGVTTLTAEVTPLSPLTAMYPGDSSQTIHVTIHNPSAQSVHPMSVSASVTGTSNVGCTATDFTVGAAATVDQEIAAGASLAVSGPTIQFNNRAVSQNACKGVTVNLAFTIS